LDSVLAKELDQLQQRVAETAKGEFFFYVTDSAKELLLREQHYDARRLKLAIERLIVYPLAGLLATDRMVGDMIRIDRDHDQAGLNFIREAEELEPEAIPGLFLSNIRECADVLS
jgi:ATP-dependent Clp protease ATP-binding subunit ClpA